jgi:hypothetical protein
MKAEDRGRNFETELEMILASISTPDGEGGFSAGTTHGVPAQ